VKKVVVIAENTTSKSKKKQWLKWPPPALTQPERNDGVIQLSPLSSCEVVETSHACFVHLILQYSPHTLVNSTGFKFGEFGGHSRGGMNSGVSVLAKMAFFTDVTLTSHLHHHNIVSSVQVLMRHFTDVTMILAENCEKLSKFIKVIGPLFRTTVY